MEWISVNDRLPEEDVIVLVYFKQNLYPLAGMLSKERRFFGYRKKLRWVDKDCFLLNERLISHWMYIEHPKN